MRIELNRHGLKLNGRARLIRAGSLDYFRLPSASLWQDRIAKIRQAGLNAVTVSYPWNYHSGAPGDYDFAGPRDVDALHDLIEESGLYLIARPGPFLGAELDLGGLPAWLLRTPSALLRCRFDGRAVHSIDFMNATREWFGHIVPRFASRSNLILVGIENEYTLPAPFSSVPKDLWDLAVRWFGNAFLARWVRGRSGARSLFQLAPEEVERGRGQASLYMRELRRMVEEYGVEVPVFHNDLSMAKGRQTDVDLLGLDRFPLRVFRTDWRDDPHAFDEFEGDEAEQEALRSQPVFYAKLQAGWHEGWSGRGYSRLRAQLGPESIDYSSKLALSEHATIWNYSPFCGGTNWGYLSSPEVYSSYDCAAPISETGGTDVRYENVRRLNEFLERFEEDLAGTESEDLDHLGHWCSQHWRSRRGTKRRFIFLRNTARQPCEIPTPEDERTELAPWEMQVRVYGNDGRLEGVSPEPLHSIPTRDELPPALPRLERWSLTGVSPQLDPAYDDEGWSQISPDQVDRGRIDMDTLGVHYGFIWYRGTFQGALDRLVLDARHCYAVWINRELVAAGDQFQNPLGVGPDGARRERISLRDVDFGEGRNVVVILVENLGHHQGFADDGANPRGIVSLDTGITRVSWRFRAGLVRGERGIAPVVAFEGAERSATQDVVLPHGWAGEPHGVALYETSFQLEGVDPKQLELGLCFDPGRGKANLYLNGFLLGRYWPERGPQQRFPLPWGILEPDRENQLAIALWKRSARAALGKVRLEAL